MRNFKFFLVCLLLLACMTFSFGQKKRRRNDVLPQVGEILDVKKAANGFPEGCGNHFLRNPGNERANSYIFAASQDNLQAWMNLDGRDLPLKLVKTIAWYRHFHPFVRLLYRAAKIDIIVNFENPIDYFDKYAARITLRQMGKAARVIRAVGLPECVRKSEPDNAFENN